MKSITITYGDGIGPEIMCAVLEIMKAASVNVSIDVVDIGQKMYERGWDSGIPDSALETIVRNKVLLKAPITTPQGMGVRSLNVTLRKKLGLYSNVRPCISYDFLGRSKCADIVIVRENEEDLYTGIEYRQSGDACSAVKVITRSASERICRYAFEYARKNHRKKITVMVKDNIMKLTDGIFHQAFNDVAAEYPDIDNDSCIIDIGAARIAKSPEDFDVVVAPNLYGDIISDIAAEALGSVGLAGSANIGNDYAMFEAVHGSAPDIAGKNIANPSGLINAAVYMLSYIGDVVAARKIYSAWYATLKKGVHTADIYNPDYSREMVGTAEFAEHVIKNIGSSVDKTSPSFFVDTNIGAVIQQEEKTLVGVDIYIDWYSDRVEALEKKLKSIELTNCLRLMSINAKGISIWPEKVIAPCITDTLSCRFLIQSDNYLKHSDINHLLAQLDGIDIEVLKLEKLYIFGEKIGFSS